MKKILAVSFVVRTIRGTFYNIKRMSCIDYYLQDKDVEIEVLVNEEENDNNYGIPGKVI